MNKTSLETPPNLESESSLKILAAKEKRKLLNKKYRTHIKNYVNNLKTQYNNLHLQKYKDYPAYWFNPFLIPKIYSRNAFQTIEHLFFIKHYNLSNRQFVVQLLEHTEQCQQRFVRRYLQNSQSKNMKKKNETKVHILYCEQLIMLYRTILKYYNIKEMIDGSLL